MKSVLECATSSDFHSRQQMASTSFKDSLMKGSHVRVSLEQREIMLQYMEEHPGMAQNKFCGLPGAATRRRLWADLASQLNACSTGASKSTEKWIKSWQDWKSDVKLKGQRQRRHVKETGAGPPLPPLTEVEERLLKIIGCMASKRVEAIPDTLNRLPENSPNPSSPFPSTSSVPSTSPIPSTFPFPSASPIPSSPHISPRRGKKRKESRDDSYASIKKRLVAAAEENAANTGRMAAAAERSAEEQKKRTEIFEDFCTKIAAIAEKTANEFIKYLNKEGGSK